jgi:hypothetical protein
MRQRAGVLFPITIDCVRREAAEAIRAIRRGPGGRFREVDVPTGFWGGPAANVAVVLPSGVRVEGLGYAEAASLARLLS